MSFPYDQFGPTDHDFMAHQMGQLGGNPGGRDAQLGGMDGSLISQQSPGLDTKLRQQQQAQQQARQQQQFRAGVPFGAGVQNPQMVGGMTSLRSQGSAGPAQQTPPVGARRQGPPQQQQQQQQLPQGRYAQLLQQQLQQPQYQGSPRAGGPGAAAAAAAATPGGPPGPGGPQGLGPGAPVAQLGGGVPLQPPMKISSPEEILSAVELVRDDAENSQQRHLLDLIERDAKQELIHAKAEKLHSTLIRHKQLEIEYYEQLREVRQVQANAVFGDGYAGYGNGWTGNKARIVYPQHRKRGGRASHELVLTPELGEAVANLPETLVPVRIDFDLDKHRLRDTFTINANDKSIPIPLLAENLAEDYYIPLSYAHQIASGISEQLADFHPHVFPDISVPKVGVPDEIRNEDMRIIVRLDITVGQHNLVDQFEWDINCAENSPEKFAESMCRELSLSGEFATAISHAIREQSQLYTKTLLFSGHEFDGRPVEDDELVRELCPGVGDHAFLRPALQIKDFSPVLFEIPHVELDRQDKDRDRDSRRKRRQGRAGRRGTAALPDLKETVRTFRTPVYNAILPGGVVKSLELIRKRAERAADSDDDDDDSPRPAPTTTGRRGRPPLHLSAQRGRPPLTTTATASPQPRVVPVDDGPHLIVTLKVPRLGEFLASRGMVR